MILLILILVVFVECKNFKMSTNICFPRAGKTIECHGKYNNNCNNFVCTKNKYTCQMLLFSFGLQNEHKRKHESFIKEIKECSEPPKYKWKSNDVCSNSKNCFYSSAETWIPIGRISYRKCNCGGKYNYKCNDDYCGLDKRACDFIKIKQSLFKIKKCQLFLNRN